MTRAKSCRHMPAAFLILLEHPAAIPIMTMEFKAIAWFNLMGAPSALRKVKRVSKGTPYSSMTDRSRCTRMMTVSTPRKSRWQCIDRSQCRGIGRAIALRLGSEGATVGVHYAVNRGAAEDVVEEIKRSGGLAFAIGSDLRTLDGIRKLYAVLERKLTGLYGSAKIDILVNNAGMDLTAGIEDTREEEFDSLLSLNLKAPFFIIQQALPYLRDHGRIIQLSSAVTRISLPLIPAYSMTKSAINGLTLSLANQLGTRGITINSIAPGFVATDMNAGMLQDQGSRQFGADYSIFGRWGEPGGYCGYCRFFSI